MIWSGVACREQFLLDTNHGEIQLLPRLPTDDLEVLPWKPDYGWFVEEQLADKDDIADYDERPEGFQMYLCKDCVKEFHRQKKERAIREKQSKEDTRQALIALIKKYREKRVLP